MSWGLFLHVWDWILICFDCAGCKLWCWRAVWTSLWLRKGTLTKVICDSVVEMVWQHIIAHYSWLFLQKDEPDAFKELGTGNRIATWLFYVSKFFLNPSNDQGLIVKRLSNEHFFKRMHNFCHIMCWGFKKRSCHFFKYVMGITLSYYHTETYLNICKPDKVGALFVLA